MEEDTVQTAVGMLRRDELDVSEVITEDFNCRQIVTEWRVRNELVFEASDGERTNVPAGSLVKRDAHVILKRGQPFGAAQAQLQ